MAKLIVRKVLVACDTCESGYRIVKTGRRAYAFVWGNIRAEVGHALKLAWIVDATDEKGVKTFRSARSAARYYREVASALFESGGRAAAREMMASLRNRTGV